MNTSWKYYRYAMLPECKPHEEPDLSVFDEKNIWKKPLWRKALFARYITQYDRADSTSWYWVVKDSPFEINALKSKYRYQMRKALDNFELKIINPLEYVDGLYEVYVKAKNQYPKSYRNTVNIEKFREELTTIKPPMFAAFSKTEGCLCGYIIMVERDKVIYYSGQAANPEYEKQYVNYALILKMLEHYSEKLSQGYYIVDGEKNINHITNHQALLVKKFGFRKAYCKLNIVYRPVVKLIINFVYPFRNILKKLDSIKIIHVINGVIEMESIVRKSNKG